MCNGELPVFGNLGVAADKTGLPAREAEQVGADILSLVVDTVPPKAKACPSHVTVLPIVIPEASISVPMVVEFAPRVVAAVGVHQTSQAEAPEVATTELAEVFNVPFILKM